MECRLLCFKSYPAKALNSLNRQVNAIALLISLLFFFPPVYASDYCHELGVAELSHGEMQVRNMIRDRPEMADYVGERDWVWIWAAQQFGGQRLPTKVYWKGIDEKPLGTEYVSSYSSPSLGAEGYITVNRVGEDGAKLDGEALWSYAIFELLNIRNSISYEKLENQVVARKITKYTFTRESAKLEYNALAQLRWFYQHIWSENCKLNGHIPNSKYWRNNLPCSFEDWFKKFSSPEWYPWSLYGKYFDELQKVDGSRSSRQRKGQVK